jgi:hypothetical protein
MVVTMWANGGNVFNDGESGNAPLPQVPHTVGLEAGAEADFIWTNHFFFQSTNI